MQEAAEILFIETGDELRDLLLRDGGGEVDVPGGQAGEGLRIAGEQTMKERGAAAQVAEDEKRSVDGLCLVGGEENIIEPEEEPVEQGTNGPDQIEEGQEDDPFSSEAGGGVFRCKKRAVESSPEQAEVISHSGWDPWVWIRAQG